ncbi:MAG: stage II sporulation protein R [Lachnospiraceae bacterium]|nr:stage II sporulation protein R [Lachnospiraceae bacterium]
MFQIIKALQKSTWFTILVFALILNFGVSAAHRAVLQQGIAEEVLRFHVLANSDSDRDQEIKYMVRDEVLRWMQEAETGQGTEAGQEIIELAETEYKGAALAESGSEPEEKAAMEQFLTLHLEEIEQIADRVLAEQNVDYHAEAALTTCYFPDRTYGDCTFPAGWYKALRISLGEAKGHNWWCVLYPKLCFSDCLHAVVDEDEMEELKGVLTVEEYESLLRKPGEWKIAFRWF